MRLLAYLFRCLFLIAATIALGVVAGFIGPWLNSVAQVIAGFVRNNWQPVSIAIVSLAVLTVVSFASSLNVATLDEQLATGGVRVSRLGPKRSWQERIARFLDSFTIPFAITTLIALGLCCIPLLWVWVLNPFLHGEFVKNYNLLLCIALFAVLFGGYMVLFYKPHNRPQMVWSTIKSSFELPKYEFVIAGALALFVQIPKFQDTIMPAIYETGYANVKLIIYASCLFGIELLVSYALFRWGLSLCPEGENGRTPTSVFWTTFAGSSLAAIGWSGIIVNCIVLIALGTHNWSPSPKPTAPASVVIQASAHHP